MDSERIRPPFDAEVLNEFARGILDEHGRDITDTVSWLLRHNSPEDMMAAIQAAWLRSSLPLHDWAKIIDNVEVEVHQNCVQLVVSLIGATGSPIRQAAPFTENRLAQLAKSFPQPLPKLMVELALTAPGLCLEDLGALAEPEFFLKRLGYLIFYLRKTDREAIQRYGFEYVNPDKQLIEVASDGYGNCYAINRDGSLVFLDHEAHGLVPCKVCLPDLIRAYLSSPEVICDPYSQQWAVFPKPPHPLPRLDTPASTLIKLSKRQRELTYLGGLAVSIRGCHRAMAGHYLHKIPVEWRPHEQALQRILEACKSVATTGVPLESAMVDEFCNVASRSTQAWRVILGVLKVDYSALFLTSQAIPALVRACCQVEDAETISHAIVLCRAVKAYREDCHETSFPASSQDTEHLIALKLGEPGTLGKPVPASFFDRPAWPEDLAPPKR